MAITTDYILKGGLRSSDEAANSRLKMMDEERIAGQKNASNEGIANRDNDAKLAQLIKGSELKQGESKQAIQDKIEGLKQLNDTGMVPDGAGAAVEGVSFQKDPTLAGLAQQNKMSAQEGQKLSAFAGKTLGPLKGQADALETIKALIDNPNSVNDQQLAVAQARLSEGQGQRLLQSVIEHSGASKTGAGSLTDLANYMRGGGMSKLQPGQVQAMRDNLNTHAKLLQQQADDASAAYHGQAQYIAPHLGPDAHEAMFQSYAKPFSGAMQRIQPPAAPVDQSVHNQALSPAPAAAGPIDKLRTLFGLSSSTPQSAAPSPAAGGTQPPSFEQWKAMKAQQGR